MCSPTFCPANSDPEAGLQVCSDRPWDPDILGRNVQDKVWMFDGFLWISLGNVCSICSSHRAMSDANVREGDARKGDVLSCRWFEQHVSLASLEGKLICTA